jgi:ABC-2 type transport system permease protein
MQNVLTLFRREVASYFDSLIAYVVIAVFLTGAGLFFWVFEYNVLETGFATLDTLFFIGPYLFLFLVPALTMRAFSEEIKTGTIEFLMTKPLQEWELIWGKYLAAVFLIFFSLLPTLIYFGSVYWLGEPVGNLDIGATIGAYIGLFFLGAVFAAIGLFTSALASNQIIAFILGLFLCFAFFMGPDLLAGVKVLSGINAFLIQLGILEHYSSISRGVVDTRDLVYFLSFIAVALLATKIALNARRA